MISFKAWLARLAGPGSAIGWVLRLSMRAQVALVVILVQSVIMLVLAFVFPTLTKRIGVDSAAQQAHGIASMTAYALAPAVVSGDRRTIEEALEIAKQNQDLAFAVVGDGTGRILASYQPLPVPIQDILDGHRFTDDGMVIESVVPILSDGAPVGYLYIGLSLRGMYARILRVSLISAAIIIFVMLFGVALVVAGGALTTVPLRRIVATVNTIMPEGLHTRADVPEQREVRQLAISFNRMLDRIQQQTDALQSEIAERQRAETALQESSQSYMRLFDSVTEAIYVQDAKGRFLNINRGALTMYGYSREEVIGQTPAMLTAPGMNDLDRLTQQLDLARRGFPQSFEWWGKRKNGEVFPKEVSLNRGTYFGQDVILAVARDISVRKKTEEQLRASLQEKEVLLKEIHHRVKNNLQVISSLLYLQSQSVGDETMLGMFQDSQNRIRSMALVHERLYMSTDLNRIDMDGYLRDLVTGLVRSMCPLGSPITVVTSAENIFLNIETAIPCGLIVNELVTNALKYAFPPRAEGEISVRIAPGGSSRYVLTVRDNGIGLPEHVSVEGTKSLGLHLVSILAAQLEGAVETSRREGTMFTVTFRGV
jgi:PAS domain S-box-containing protein